MKPKITGFLTLLFALSVQFVFAQKTISGTVSDESGPLPGASVIIKGTKTGTETDFDGKYSIQAKQGDVLVFSYIGMETQSIKVTDLKTIDVLMVMDKENVLTEVVINALGIETTQKVKTSSTSKVDGSDIVKSGESSVIKGLSAKASGVTVVNSSGDPGASAYIQIRGQTTITRDVQPLFVIDGVPVNNDELGGYTAGVAEQSRMNDINPDDVASVQILKGASAAALWGSRAANGVILITTKSGKTGTNDKLTISVSSKISYDTPLTKMKLQDTFGKGRFGVWNDIFDLRDAGSWGDNISLRSGQPNDVYTSGNYFEAADGTIIYPINTGGNHDKTTYDQKNYDAVFGTGTLMDSGISIGAKSGNSNLFFSFNYLDQIGVIGKGKNYYKRYATRFNANTKLTDKATLKANFAYSNVNSNRIQQGSNLSGLLLGLYRTPPDFDNTYYIGTRYTGSEILEKSQRSYRTQTGVGGKGNPGYNNPLWTINEQKNPNEVNRFIGGVEINLKTNNWLNLISKLGIDTYNDDRLTYFPINSGEGDTQAGIGSAGTDYIVFNMYNLDFMAQINKDVSERIKSNFTLGVNTNQEVYNERYAYYEDFKLNSDIINFQNTVKDNTTYGSTYTSKKRTVAFYGVADFAYNNLLNLHFTGRYDQSSSFVKGKGSFYPSAELSFQINELLKKDYINNAKLRIGYGIVGNQPEIYSTSNDYYYSASGYDSYGTSYGGKAYGGSFVPSAIFNSYDLRPERLEEIEVGFDFGFINNRITSSINIYSNKTTDVLLYLPNAASTGYSRTYSNAGIMENKGIEFETDFKLIRNDNFNWSLGGNWSKNKNMVVSLNGVEEVSLAGFLGITSSAVEGYPLGVLYGDRYMRDTAGNIVLDDKNFPKKEITDGVIGDPNPDWKGGLNTSISYKNITLSGLADISWGGDVWYGTYGALTHFGRTPITANTVTVSATDASSIINILGTTIAQNTASTLNPDGTYTIRGNLYDFGGGKVLLDEEYYRRIGGGFNGPAEQFIVDGTWAKLRELTLSYTLSSTLLERTKIQSIDLSITGRNLYLWTKADLDFDPESNLTGASNGRGLQYFNHPTTKSYLASIKLNF